MDLFKPTYTDKNPERNTKLEKISDMLQELLEHLPKEIVKANNEWRDSELRFNIERRPVDRIHQAYCHYALIKIKCDLNIYE